jgi:lysophospholipase L1-like esterase
MILSKFTALTVCAALAFAGLISIRASAQVTDPGTAPLSSPVPPPGPNPIPAVTMAIPTSLPPVAQVRRGLPHVFASLRHGRPVTIVYLGGSITAGTGSSNADMTSYRALVGKWFTTTYPQDVITNVNAAVGGTGSDLGAFRTDYDVLSKHPDLVFVEFAVNDAANTASQQGMEGIVRQIRRANPQTDICFVYTYQLAGVKRYESGTVLPTVKQDETIASYYNISSVNVGEAEAETIMSSGIVPSTMFHDGTHPNDAGHKAYSEAIIAFLNTESATPPAGANTSGAERLLPPLRGDSFEYARMIGIDGVSPLGAGWSITTSDPTKHFQSILISSTPGSQQTISFTGSTIGLYWIAGPDAGEFDYQIDAGASKTVSTSDRYSANSYRPFYRILESDLAPGPHTMTITVLREHDIYSTGTTIRIGKLMVNAPQ